MICTIVAFSSSVVENGLYIDQSKLLLFDEETGKSYDCVVHTASSSMHQKYIGRGWYEFILENGLKLGDIILFTDNNPPNRMYATIVNWG